MEGWNRADRGWGEGREGASERRERGVKWEGGGAQGWGEERLGREATRADKNTKTNQQQ